MPRYLEAIAIATHESTLTASTTTTHSNCLEIEVSRTDCAFYDGDYLLRHLLIGQTVPNGDSDRKAVIVSPPKNYVQLDAHGRTDLEGYQKCLVEQNTHTVQPKISRKRLVVRPRSVSRSSEHIPTTSIKLPHMSWFLNGIHPPRFVPVAGPWLRFNEACVLVRHVVNIETSMFLGWSLSKHRNYRVLHNLTRLSQSRKLCCHRDYIQLSGTY